jgi:hypothetical protein
MDRKWLSAVDVLGGNSVLRALPESDLDWIALVREGIAVSCMAAVARIVGISSHELARVLVMSPLHGRSISA